MRGFVLWTLGLCLVWGSGGQAAERPALQDLGRRVKMRILVDKVMQPTRNWQTEEWMIREAAEAGFNVFSPRRGYEDLEAVRRVTNWCRQHGLYHQVWMRGAQDVPKDKLAASAGKRMLWANGHEQMIWSPNADELWDWLAAYILRYAEISAQDETLMGVFLDFENYWPDGMGNLYDLSYDDVIMKKFAAQKGIAYPDLAPEARKPWLEEKGLHDEFRAFQISYWRQKCRELRQAVDKINPRFQFNVYPAPGTLFIREACYPEWATQEAPLILADACTYGRPAAYMPQEEALRRNQAWLQERRASARATGINCLYLGGIDPIVRGADPEFCGKNALMIAGVSEGYWVFYEGPQYDKDHPEYFKWFAWANQRIERGEFQAAWAPRETEEAWLTGFRPLAVQGRPLPRSEKRDFPLVKLRGRHILIVAAHRNKPLQIGLRVFRVGRNEDGLRWALKGKDWNDLARGEIAVEAQGRAEYTPAEDGLLLLLADAGANAFAITEANAAIGIWADPPPHFLANTGRLYFAVPASVQEFVLTIRGGGGIETAKLTVYDPTGAVAGSAEATSQADAASVRIRPGEHAGKSWALEIDKAAEGVLEDSYLTLDRALPKILSYFPDEVFTLESGPR